MPRQTIALALALGAAVAALAAAMPAPALADVDSLWVDPAKMATPPCEAFPDYPVVGRTAGYLGLGSKRSVSFVGCFPSYGDCELWRRGISGQFGGRIIINACSARY